MFRSFTSTFLKSLMSTDREKMMTRMMMTMTKMTIMITKFAAGLLIILVAYLALSKNLV